MSPVHINVDLWHALESVKAPDFLNLDVEVSARTQHVVSSV
eukprot:CAMPEP_0173429316 /NCGR_PEP_ID=MMETSP1357-20121228/8056_1 /TAXON_ID=77926 /ORGANISM="Hemiselmis rufescens, Strain PCC563" /LENGTH=40 /DNA_ID= /DNA_START= /DNA_END= /DNA_ORIENTATION=